jgi:hypothetical protein
MSQAMATGAELASLIFARLDKELKMGILQKEVRAAIELIRSVREKVQGDVEDSVVHQLDEAISIFEEIDRKLEEMDHKEPDQQVYQDLLKLLGNTFKYLPAIAKLIEILRDLI